MADFKTELPGPVVTDKQIPDDGHQEVVDDLGLVPLDKVDHLKAQTRVEVRMQSLPMIVLLEAQSSQRLFNFAQIFFLSLTFMSGWETMGL
jgi:hypothetical protein